METDFKYHAINSIRKYKSSCAREKPRYFHFDVYVSFLFGSRSFNRKLLLNYKFTANSKVKSHRITLFDFCVAPYTVVSSIPPAYLTLYPSARIIYRCRQNINVKNREIILKETTIGKFVFILYIYIYIYIYILSLGW